MKKYMYLFCIAFIPAVAFSQNKTITIPGKSWYLRGNKNTDTAVNFLGTLDANPLLFKTNNLRSGYIDYDSTAANTSFGYQSLQFNTSIQNAAFGYRAMASNIGGQLDVAVGAYALNQNAYGLGNTAIGSSTLQLNTNGSANTAIGVDAMLSNTNGSNNVAIGSNALQHNDFGGSNVAIGNLSLVSNNAYYNTAIGESSMYSNTNGTANVALGVFPLFINTTGSYNTALGYGSLFTNTTGNNNTAVGNSALFSNTTGNNNTAIGYNANEYGNINNATAIGYNAFVDSGNKVRLGNDNVLSIGGVVGFTNYASDDVKKDIRQNVPGLEFIKALRPVTYNLNIPSEFITAKTDAPLTENARKYLQTANKFTDNSSRRIETIRFTGFIAREVNAAAKKVNYSFSGIDKNGIKWGIRYEEFVVPLVQAVKELSIENDNDKNTIDSLEKTINDLGARLDHLEKLMNNTISLSINNSSINSASDKSVASLGQNVPNPFVNTTSISYNIPASVNNASINFYNLNGALLKSVHVTQGKGTISFKASQLPAGIYQYSLINDNVVVDTKKMIQSN